MQINTEYYGTGRETVYGDVEYTDYTIAEALNAGDLPFNEQFDLSICPWRIGSGSDMFKMCFPILYTDDTSPSTSSTWIYDKHPLFKDGQDGYPFYFGADYGATSGQRDKTIWWDGRTKPNVTGEISPSGFNSMRDTSIITNLDYSKLCYAVMLHTSEGYKPLDDALEYFDPETYDPDAQDAFQVYGVAFIPFYWTGTTFTQTNWCMSCLSEGKPYGGTNSASQYYDDWFDPCINVNPGNYFSLGGQYTYTTNNRGYRYGFGRGGESTARINDEYWIYDLNNPASVNYPQRDIYDVPMWFQAGEHWEQKVYRFDAYDGWSLSAWTYARLKLEDFATVDEFADYIRTQAAYMGCYFITDAASPAADLYPLKNNPGVYLGEITSGEQAITTGAYRKGTAQTDFDNSQWTSDPWAETPDPSYIPDKDPTDWDEDQTSVISSATGDPSYGTREYLMSANALNELVRVLNELKIGEIEGDVSEGYCERAFGSSDPMAAIISVIKYPFDMIYNWLGSSSREVVHGTNVGSWFQIANAQIAVDTSGSTPPPYTIGLTSAHEIYEISWASSSIWEYGVAKIPYFNKYKSFLDYEPYCNAALYLPFCGSIRIDPEVYVGHDVTVKYIVSPLDGTVKAYILRDNLVIDTLAGNAGTSIEINTSDDLAKANTVNQLNATIQSQKMHVVKSLASFASTAGLGVATGGASLAASAFIGAAKGGALGGVLDAAQHDLSIGQSQYQIATTATPFKQLQSGGGYLSAADEYAIRLVAYRPEPLPGYTFRDWGSYGATTGFACLEIGSLSGFTGYTECAQVIADGIQCTNREKNMIIKLLQAGVYL